MSKKSDDTWLGFFKKTCERIVKSDLPESKEEPKF